MLNLSPKKNLVYTFIILAVIALAIAFLLFYFLNYYIKKTTSVPNQKVESTIIEINAELLAPSPEDTKGGEHI